MNKETPTENENTVNGYEEEYHKDKHQHLYTNQDYYKARSELAKKRYFKGIDNLETKKILEFGCGLGQNLFWLPEHRRVGYDVSKFATNFFRAKGGNATTDITRIPDNAFDIVLSAHVLEHVENPLETLRVIHSKLRKGGRLVLVTPIDKVGFGPGIGKKIDKDDTNQHLWTWTPQLMYNLLVKAGFKPECNEVIATCAYKKLLPFRKLGLRTYDWATKLAGKIVRDKELKFVGVKV